MPRRVQDIIPGDRRSIRNIPIEPIQTKTEKPSKANSQEKTGNITPSRSERGRDIQIRKMPLTPPLPIKKSKNSKKTKRLWYSLLITIPSAAVVIAVSGFMASTYFYRATFTIVPKIIPVSVNGTYVIKNSLASLEKDSLTYDIITVSGTASSAVPATDGPLVSTKAQGKVIIYNSHSSESQRLVAGTRLANDNGRIYRITGSIVIPGYKSSGGTVLPGSIITTVVADEAGAGYNISKSDPLSDFKIVAYKGSDKYQNFYARLDTDISGGFVGKKKIISPTLQASTTAVLSADLKKSLLIKVAAVIPNEFVSYDDANIYDIVSMPISDPGAGKAVMNIQGTLHAIVLKKTDLVPLIAGKETVASFGEMKYEVSGLENLKFSVANEAEFSAVKKNPLIIRLQGPISLIGTVNIEELKNSLAGLPLGETEAVLGRYTQVISLEKSTGELSPPWSPRVPTDTNHISVIIKKP